MSHRQLEIADVVAWLASAPFEDVLTAVGTGLARRDDAPRDGVGECVGLAMAIPEEGRWEFAMAAGSRPGEGPAGGEPWCQFGGYPRCGLALVAAAKHACCPACGAAAYLT